VSFSKVKKGDEKDLSIPKSADMMRASDEIVSDNCITHDTRKWTNPSTLHATGGNRSSRREGRRLLPQGQFFRVFTGGAVFEVCLNGIA
jgi:hypothetical protein